MRRNTSSAGRAFSRSFSSLFSRSVRTALVSSSNLGFGPGRVGWVLISPINCIGSSLQSPSGHKTRPSRIWNFKAAPKALLKNPKAEMVRAQRHHRRQRRFQPTWLKINPSITFVGVDRISATVTCKATHRAFSRKRHKLKKLKLRQSLRLLVKCHRSRASGPSTEGPDECV